MQTNWNPPDRRAPLAVRESVESRLGERGEVVEVNEMKDFRRFEKPRDLKLPTGGPGQGGNSREFYDLSRKQQNVKMYKVSVPSNKGQSSTINLGCGPRHTGDVLRVVRAGEHTEGPGEEN